MILSIIGVAALVALSSYCFATFAAKLIHYKDLPGDPLTDARFFFVLCGLSFFGALALLGSLLG